MAYDVEGKIDIHTQLVVTSVATPKGASFFFTLIFLNFSVVLKSTLVLGLHLGTQPENPPFFVFFFSVSYE
eukprot:m.157060 g.157060  ORF g.157060 m.157060 type:complete len:71 (+) comp14453_c0_seq5:1100-1312(+)